MKILSTLLGYLILFAGAAGVYYLFQYRAAPEEEAESETVTEVPVMVGAIQQGTLHGSLQAYGTVALQLPGLETPPALVSVTSSQAGLITAVQCRPGGSVNQGDILFRLDSRQADLTYAKAAQAVDFAQKEFERQENLRKIQGTSDKLYEQALAQLKAARQDLELAGVAQKLLAVPAPISGVIVRLDAAVGQSVAPAQILAELQDLNRLVVAAQIPSHQAGRLKVGQQTEILPGDHNQNTNPQKLTGTVCYIDSQVDPQTGTRTVYATVPENSGLCPGQFVGCRIIYEVHENCLTVPVEAVVTAPDGQSWIAVVDGDTASRRAVQTGLREEGLVEIQGPGLSAGMVIVTEGVYGLPDETNIRIIGR